MNSQQLKSRIGRRTAGIALVLALAAASLIAVVSVAAGGDEAKVRSTVIGALHAQQEVALPPGSYQGGPLTDAQQQEMVASGSEGLAKFFSGTQLEVAKGVLTENIAEQASGEVRYLAAGVKDIDFISVVIDGDTARAEVDARVWAVFKQVEANGAEHPAQPENGIHSSLTLQRLEGEWFVTDEAISFLPGESP
jgi:hypothetical protein